MDLGGWNSAKFLPDQKPVLGLFLKRAAHTFSAAQGPEGHKMSAPPIHCNAEGEALRG